MLIACENKLIRSIVLCILLFQGDVAPEALPFDVKILRVCDIPS